MRSGTFDPFTREAAGDAEPLGVLRRAVRALELEGKLSPDMHAALAGAVAAVMRGPGPAELAEKLEKGADIRLMAAGILAAAEATKPLPLYGELDPDPAPPRWLVPGIMLESAVTLFSGAGGLGKSRLMCQVAATLAAGQKEWLVECFDDFEIAPKPRRVMFASYEDDRAAFSRTFAQSQLPAMIRGKWKDRIRFLNLQGRGFMFGPKVGAHVLTVAETTALGRRIREEAVEWGADLLIVDPLGGAYGSDENVRVLVRAFLDEWSDWCRESGCALCLVAHPSKANEFWSGHTEWRNAVRTLLNLGWHTNSGQPEKPRGGKQPDKCLGLRVHKQSYGREQTLWLKRRRPGLTWEQTTWFGADQLKDEGKEE